MINNVITSNVEMWAKMQSDSRQNTIIKHLQMVVQHRMLRAAQRNHLKRAAMRAFGAGFDVLWSGKVVHQGREYTYNFTTGRFYGASNA